LYVPETESEHGASLPKELARYHTLHESIFGPDTVYAAGAAVCSGYIGNSA
jgi:hypothetical protein